MDDQRNVAAYYRCGKSILLQGASFCKKGSHSSSGFDENLFAENAKADKRNWNDLLEEFKVVRKATEWLYGSFDEEQLNATGTSNNSSIYVLAFGFISIGHTIHHMNVIKQRYLS
jgi:hypothetical protein